MIGPTKRHHKQKLADYFHSHPEGIQPIIEGNIFPIKPVYFLVAINYNFIWLPILRMKNIDKPGDCFYCTRCKKMLRISGKATNIWRHAQREDPSLVILNEDKDNKDEKLYLRITTQLKLFILLNGYPFSAIEDPDLNQICNLLSRKKLTDEAVYLAEKIKC